MNRLPASTGLLWLKQGFSLFRKQPGLLSMLLFANFSFTFLLMRVPLLGQILPVVLLPAFNMAIFQACRDLDAGERITPAVLLTGFRKGKAGPLARLGLVYFGLAMLLSVAVTPWIDISAIQAAAEVGQKGGQPTLPQATTLAVLALMVLLMIMNIILSFAPALTHWKSMPIFKSIFYSVFAILGSLAPMLVMLGLWFGLCMFAMSTMMALFGGSKFMLIVIMWIGLISASILQCSLYAAYRHLLPDTK
ncbi:MAG TPA: BPSS1780 family membrane protein [Telluria sp.]|jgi:hypothetical protein